MTKRILSFLMALMLLCGIASIAAAEEPVTLTIATTRRTTDITESVSYTHLDVYKRQPWLYPSDSAISCTCALSASSSSLARSMRQSVRYCV